MDEGTPLHLRLVTRSRFKRYIPFGVPALDAKQVKGSLRSAGQQVMCYRCAGLTAYFYQFRQCRHDKAKQLRLGTTTFDLPYLTTYLYESLPKKAFSCFETL